MVELMLLMLKFAHLVESFKKEHGVPFPPGHTWYMQYLWCQQRLRCAIVSMGVTTVQGLSTFLPNACQENPHTVQRGKEHTFPFHELVPVDVHALPRICRALTPRP